jgi:prolyl-tRNA editing enzyme YbaK/EbsC (Cys-tRNA(Pro) deacylase)
MGDLKEVFAKVTKHMNAIVNSKSKAENHKIKAISDVKKE